jgi:oligoendopeptidase F
MVKSVVAGPARKRKDAQVFPPFPRRFAPEGLDAGSKQALDPVFMDLEERPLASAGDLVRWLEDWSELASVIAEEESKRYIEHTCRTNDPDTERRYLEFQREIAPFVKPRFQHLKEKFAAAPHRTQIDPDRYHVLNRSILSEVELYREDNVPLETRDAELVADWQRISGAMMHFGRQGPTIRRSRASWTTDRARRKSVSHAARRLRDRDPIDALRRGKTATPRAPRFRSATRVPKGRFDDTPDDCRRRRGRGACRPPAFGDAGAEGRRPASVGLGSMWTARHPAALRESVGTGGVRTFSRASIPRWRNSSRRSGDRGISTSTAARKAPGGYQCTPTQRVPPSFHEKPRALPRVITPARKGPRAPRHPLRTIRRRRTGAPTEFCEGRPWAWRRGPGAHRRFAESRCHGGAPRLVPGDPAHLPDRTIDAFQHEFTSGPTRRRPTARWAKQRQRFLGGDDWTARGVSTGRGGAR